MVYKTSYAYTFLDAYWKPVRWTSGLFVFCHVCIQFICASEGLLREEFRDAIGLCNGSVRMLS